MDHLEAAEALLAGATTEGGSNALMCHAMIAIAQDVRRIADAAVAP